MAYREGKARGKLAAILVRLKACGCQQDIVVAPLVLNTDLRATLLFGAGLWGSYGLSGTDPVEHQLQRPYNTLARAILGLPSKCPHWVTLMLAGQLPIQYHVIKEFCRLWNRFVRTAQANPLIKSCIEMQAQLLTNNRACWLKRWCDRLRVVLPNDDFQHIHTALGSLQNINHRGILKSLVQWSEYKLHQCGDPVDPACTRRRTAMVYRNFHLGTLGKKPAWHYWEWDDLPLRVWRSWTSFISTHSCLPVHAMREHCAFEQRVCPHCTLGEVGDEPHAVFRCEATMHVRHKYPQLFPVGQRHDLRSFWCRNNSADLPRFVDELLAVYRQP